MIRTILCLLVVLVVQASVHARQARTMTGTVVDEVFADRWDGIVISVGARRYGIQTGYHPSAGDESRGEKSWRLPIDGSYEKGNRVRVTYTSIDCAADGLFGDGVRCSLNATRIVKLPPVAANGQKGTSPGVGFYLELVSCNACGAHGNQIVGLLGQSGVNAFNGTAMCPEGTFTRDSFARASRITRNKGQGRYVSVMIGPFRTLDSALDVASRLRSLLRPVFEAGWDKGWPNSRFAHDVGNSYNLEPLTLYVVRRQ